ncbi:hypothetical protein HYH03_016812 [Edaphochlamys debaryana]|uniref:Alpha-taxilin n=1 Tax=Edaphochlamys debaryana TaxID=47281 RepID=A0A835XHW4_9CHLO|nr:hypothetical protein HYH03_016812 [Edaphochlamys debaryana]|eukprot:KAG2484398.1 hypothetical protein HYH03_016812 [Edaphochlamys debaryana]
MADVAAEPASLELDSLPASEQSSPEPAAPASGGSPSTSPKAAAAQDVSVQAAKSKKSKDLSADFVNVLTARIDEIERAVAAGHGGPAEREAAKARKKQLREASKFCSDRSNSVEDRIFYIQQKYTQQLSELLRVERQFLDLQREHEAVAKEKDKVQAELKKTNLLKDKLEELCRQLQKEAREVAEESRRRNEEELKQRQALQARFTQAINEVSEKMDAQASERSRQLAENEELRAKLDAFLGQFESFNALVQKKDLELQLAHAKAEQAVALATQMQQRAELLQEANGKYSAAMDALKPQLSELEGLRQRNAMLSAAKDELQTQLEHYADKFSEFQDTLTKSNETFASLREQMEASAKARAHIARERDEARKRAEANDSTIVALVQDRLQLKQQVESLTGKLRTEGDELRRVRTQKERLEGLCRVLQTEVKAAKAGGAAAAGAEEARGDAGEVASSSSGADGAADTGAAEEQAGSGASGEASAATGGPDAEAAGGEAGGAKGSEAKEGDRVLELPSDLY